MAKTDAAEPERLLASGHPEAAQRILDARIQSNPNSDADWGLLARTHYAQERWDSAISAAERAITLSPQVGAFHWWLGRASGEKADHISVFNMIGAYRLARRVRTEFERAVALDPNNPSAQSDLAEYYFSAPGFVGGDKTKARSIAEKIGATSPATGRWIEAQIAERNKDYSEAERLYRDAIQAADEKAPYWLNLAHFFEKRDRIADMENAVGEAARAKDFDGQPSYDAAEMLLRAGRNFPAAIQWLRHYISSGPYSESAPIFRAHYMIGALLEKQGDITRAAAEYRQALALVADYGPAKEALQKLPNGKK